MKETFNGRSVFTMLFLLSLFVYVGSVSAQTTIPNATLFGVTTNNQLVRFNATSPENLTIVGSITGLQLGENLLGIDFRPATGQLYGLGSTNRIYVINKATGAATSVGVLSTALSGILFGFDFDPVVDRIRIVSNTGQNLRVNPDNASVIVEGVINPAGAQVTAAAYSNNFAGATTTTLYDIDTGSDTLNIQNPPNSGTLVPVGPLGVNFSAVNGFDIFSGTNTAYAVTTTPFSNSLFFTINLTTGAASPVGVIGGKNFQSPLIGLAVETGAPPAAVLSGFGLTTNNGLYPITTATGNTGLIVFGIFGLPPGENILAIDYRPATGQLYGLGSSSRLYLIAPGANGLPAATPVGAAGAFTLNGTSFGFDFNPTVDMIRVVSNTGQNLRLNPNTGTATVDPNLNGAATGADAAGYTNNFAGTSSTTLYDISSATDTLYIQNPANAGTLTAVGSLGFDVTNLNGFDISNINNTAYAALQINGNSGSGLFRINLATGAATFLFPFNVTSKNNQSILLRGLAFRQGIAKPLDFDGDGRADYAVQRLSTNTFFVNRSSDNSTFSVQFGLAGEDILTPGDYDGDGRTDIAVFRSSTGTFFVLRSSDNMVRQFQFGLPGDEPVARDYDGDGRTDYAVVRRSGGVLTWFITNSSNNSVRIEQFGLDVDVVAPGDYDGDGRFDLAVFSGRPGQQAIFYVRQSSNGSVITARFGLGGDVVVPGDYDGDRRTDFAVVRLGTPYVWYVLRSSDNQTFQVQFGTKPHFTAQADYDGDGRTDIAVFDPISGNFIVRRSSDDTVSFFKFGQNGDYPIANYDSH